MKVISLKVTVSVQMQYKPAYFEAAVQHFSSYALGIPDCWMDRNNIHYKKNKVIFINVFTINYVLHDFTNKLVSWVHVFFPATRNSKADRFL